MEHRLKELRAFAPATLANVGAGFDVLGAALTPNVGGDFGNQIRIAEAPVPGLEVTGTFANRLPVDPDQNLVIRARSLYEEAIGQALPPLAIRLDAALPVSGGLGSSASSIVATLVALDAWMGGPLCKDRLLELAGRAEGEGAGGVHLDNVAPCLLGGLRLTTGSGTSVELPFPDDLVFVIGLPDLELSTREARAVLPETIARGGAVSFGRNLASFVHALHVDDRSLLAASLQDALAEPYREHLVRGFGEAKAHALTAGALGASFSGSGPATFALAEEERAQAVANALVAGFRKAGVAATSIVCRLDRRGARLL